MISLNENSIYRFTINTVNGVKKVYRVIPNYELENMFYKSKSLK